MSSDKALQLYKSARKLKIKGYDEDAMRIQLTAWFEEYLEQVEIEDVLKAVILSK